LQPQQSVSLGSKGCGRGPTNQADPTNGVGVLPDDAIFEFAEEKFRNFGKSTNKTPTKKQLCSRKELRLRNSSKKKKKNVHFSVHVAYVKREGQRIPEVHVHRHGLTAGLAHLASRLAEDALFVIGVGSSSSDVGGDVDVVEGHLDWVFKERSGEGEEGKGPGRGKEEGERRMENGERRREGDNLPVGKAEEVIFMAKLMEVGVPLFSKKLINMSFKKLSTLLIAVRVGTRLKEGLVILTLGTVPSTILDSEKKIRSRINKILTGRIPRTLKNS
jgi:hypothetical protein